jgi:class 3 adenylate cyclase/tetratricopeptide (TPR) repeat protein
MRTLAEIQDDLKKAVSLREGERALVLAEELEGLATTEARALSMQTRADVLRWASRHAEALDLYEKALKAFTSVGDMAGIANVTNNKANLHWSTGDRETAVALWDRALGIHKGRGDRSNTARVTMNLGAAYSMLGDLKAALRHYFEGLAIAEADDNKVLMSTAFGNIGIAYKLSGDYAQAISYFSRAFEIHTALGHKTGLATTALNFGTVYKLLGELDRALEHTRTAFELYDAVGDRSGAAMSVQHMGSVLHDMGKDDAALAEFDRAYAVYQEIGERAGMAHSATNKAMLLMDRGSFEEAESVVTLVEDLGVAEAGLSIELRILRAKGMIHRGDHAGGHVRLMDALALATSAGVKEETMRIHQLIRDLAYERRDIDAYVEHNRAFLALSEEIKGSEASRRIAMSDAQRLIDAERLQKERHQNLVHTMLPRTIAERVLRGETINDAVEFAAVLFIDMVDFTGNSAALTSSELVTLLDRIFSEFDRIAARHDLIKIKTIGDSYMAVAIDAPSDDRPIDRRDLVQRIANAAIEATRVEFPWPNADPDTRVMFRAGLHCGPLTAGVVGTQRLQYDVWGDTVNVASRMESTGEPGRVQVSEAFAAVLNGERTEGRNGEKAKRREGEKDVEVILRGTIDIKGKGAMTTYWLEGA